MSSIRRYNYPLGTPIGGQDVVNLNEYQSPFEVTVNVILNGSGAYLVQVTTDSLMGSPDDLNWTTIEPIDGTLSNQTAPEQYSIRTPYTGLRLYIDGLSGSINMTVIQAVGSLYY